MHFRNQCHGIDDRRYTIPRSSKIRPYPTQAKPNLYPTEPMSWLELGPSLGETLLKRLANCTRLTDERSVGWSVIEPTRQRPCQARIKTGKNLRRHSPSDGRDGWPMSIHCPPGHESLGAIPGREPDHRPNVRPSARAIWTNKNSRLRLLRACARENRRFYGLKLPKMKRKLFSPTPGNRTSCSNVSVHKIKLDLAVLLWMPQHQQHSSLSSPDSRLSSRWAWAIVNQMTSKWPLTLILACWFISALPRSSFKVKVTAGKYY